MGLKEGRRKGVYWIELVQDWVQCVADHFDYWLMLINEVNRHLFMIIYFILEYGI
jgi:hypothetical protein